MKVVVFSHGHPEFAKGGAEVAAWNLARGIDAVPGHEAWFVGRVDQRVLPQYAQMAALGDRNYIMASNAHNTDLTGTISFSEDGHISQFLRRLAPDVIHFHHYAFFGMELIRLAKRNCPDARIVVTLHEYLAMCAHHGQMVKTDGRLCYKSSPRECHLCFPDIPPEQFFLRERWIKSSFNLVDMFISPSEFLRQRYVDWGIEPERITVIENGLPEEPPVPPRPLREGEGRTRFAYFGQINPFKGVDLLLEAFARLPKKLRKQVTLDIFGSALDQQAPEFQEKVRNLMGKLKGTAHLHGPYEPHEMGRLMAEVDWVVMGSIWWENSPLVIQEAFKFGRPIIVPDIGGMAEKVKPGQGGLTYRARDSVSLANRIATIATGLVDYESCQKNMPQYSRLEDAVERHMEVYRGEIPSDGGACR